MPSTNIEPIFDPKFWQFQKGHNNFPFKKSVDRLKSSIYLHTYLLNYKPTR